MKYQDSSTFGHCGDGSGTNSFLSYPPSQCIWVDAEAHYRMKFRLEEAEKELARLRASKQYSGAMRPEDFGSGCGNGQSAATDIAG